MLEYVDAGDIQWKDEEEQPIVDLEDARRYFRDTVLGLEYRMHNVQDQRN